MHIYFTATTRFEKGIESQESNFCPHRPLAHVVASYGVVSTYGRADRPESERACCTPASVG